MKRLYNAIPVKNYKSLGTVFETTSGLYVYDTGTGKVFSCNEVTYNLFKIIFSGGDTNEIYEKYSAQEINKSISEIIEMIQKENILQASYSEFDRETDFELEAIYNYSLQSLILEVTQKCNFRCKYCIYHSFNEYYRNYGLQDMNWETAKKAIDYVSRHSGEKELSIAFYGGEPLINYDVMKKTIEYSEMVMPKKTLIFAFTTNLSLMTLEKAKFFAKHNCYIMCSLDGPKIIHDAYRVDIKGDGTFNKVIEGLKNLLIAFGDRAKTHIKFNVVICPPYSRKKLDAIKEFFDKLDYCCIRLVTILYSTEKICYTPSKTVLEDADMPRYIVTLTNDEIQELKAIIQKGGKGYRIKHAQILLKLDQKPENKAWTYDRIKDAYGAARSTIAGIAQRFVMGGMEAALGRKVQENRRRKVTGDVEARICAIACSEPPEGASRWTMQAIADELIRLEVVDYITDSTVCEVMKKMKSSRGS